VRSTQREPYVGVAFLQGPGESGSKVVVLLCDCCMSGQAARPTHIRVGQSILRVRPEEARVLSSNELQLTGVHEALVGVFAHGL
jgi:hypothetical protein